MLASKRSSEKLVDKNLQPSKRSKIESGDGTCGDKKPDSTLKSKSKKNNETILVNPEFEERVEVNSVKRTQLNTAAHIVRTFTSERFEIRSPDVLCFTSCCQVPHITADLYDKSVIGDIQVVSLHSVITHPGACVLKTLGKTLAQYTSSCSKIILTPYNSSEPCDLQSFNDQLSVSVWNKAGRKKVTCREYVDIVEACSPEMFVSLSDVVPPTVSKKRANKSCYRTLNWVEETLSLLMAKSGNVATQLLAPIPGSGHRQLMMKSAKILGSRDVFGYVIERATLPQDWGNLVRDVISVLPNSRPVMMMGVLNELELVQAYNCGCHFVDSSFVLHYSNNGQAMAVDVSNPEKLQDPKSAVAKVPSSQFGPSLSESAINIKPEDKPSGKIKLFSLSDYLPSPDLTLDLRSPAFALQFIPLNNTCTCVTCARHTRGYVNHLLVTHELLAPTLLMLHNLAHVRGLVDEVKRRVVASNNIFAEESKHLAGLEVLVELYTKLIETSEQP